MQALVQQIVYEAGGTTPAGEGPFLIVSAGSAGAAVTECQMLVINRSIVEGRMISCALGPGIRYQGRYGRNDTNTLHTSKNQGIYYRQTRTIMMLQLLVANMQAGVATIELSDLASEE